MFLHIHGGPGAPASVFAYRVDAPYAPAADRSVRFDDPAIGVEWGIEDPILSKKDAAAPLLADSDVRFRY